ncbi:MAG: hypothetical protein WCO25_03095 [Candidatus Uhrbacteria bacterium]
MPDMPDGFLNFHAHPSPAHERVLERLAYLTSRPPHLWDLGFPIPATTPSDLDLAWNDRQFLLSRAAIHELAMRVCGTAIPQKEVATVGPLMIQYLTHIGVVMPSCKDLTDGTISWIRRTYL